MAATVRVSYASGAGPTLTNAETGVKWNREETLAGTTAPVPVPTSTGTNYSWPKPMCLEVTGADTTSISNRRIRASASPATGLSLWYRDDGTTYQRGNAALTDNASTNNAAPAGFTALPTTDTVYDASSITAASGRNGDYVSFALGVSANYAGGAGTAIATPSIIFTYDET